MKNSPHWYQKAVFYELNVRAFYDSTGNGVGDLQGLAQKMGHFHDIGIDCVWLMPIFPSPLKDDGYDIADFTSIHPDLGTLDDFRHVINVAHGLGIRIVIDLVINHVSDQHVWFQQARQDPSSKYRDYFVWSNTDQKYKEARIIFIDTESSNWTWDEVAGQFYWHRFYDSQPDLNFDNPAVQKEILDVVRFWLDIGVDGFRVDAVPYLFEREGSNCENLKETHDFLKKLRRHVQQIAPHAILLCEANQWPRDLMEYFGQGDKFHLAFHFPLMPRVFMSLKKGNAEDIKNILEQTPELPEGCEWCTFLRNHDELTLEMVTEKERAWMWEQYAPEPRMRLNLGIRRRLAPLLENNKQKILLANNLLFTLPGTPIIYYGDEIGMGDNIWLHDRNGVRTPLLWDASFNGGFSTASAEDLFLPIIDSREFPLNSINIANQKEDPASLLENIKAMVRNRKRHEALTTGVLHWLTVGTLDNIVAYIRESENQRILVVSNFIDEERNATILLPNVKASIAIDLLKNVEIPIASNLVEINLKAFDFIWLEIK